MCSVIILLSPCLYLARRRRQLSKIVANLNLVIRAQTLRCDQQRALPFHASGK
jgi:hypothetical protein